MTERRPGPDHALYPHSPLPGRRPLRWPKDARIAVAVFLYFESWELDPPPGSAYDRRHDGPLGGIFPNYKVHSQYEYGNRVAIVRVLKALDRHRLPVTLAANALACENYPYLVEQFCERGYEFAAHGWSATRMLSSQMTADDERYVIAGTVATIEQACGTRPAGWIGQDYGESAVTTHLLSELGFRYVVDWGNDDQPYCLNTAPPLISIPNQAEWDDLQMVWHRKVHPAVWRDTTLEAFAQLHSDGATSGTVFGLHIHPWVIGAPHRIAYLEHVVERIAAASDVWPTTAGRIAEHVNAG